MSTIWNKADDKCHFCKGDINEYKDGDYFCSPCEEWNGWQDSSLSLFVRIVSWLGRKYW